MPLSKKQFATLRPKGHEGEKDFETFDLYAKRIRPLLPGWPDDVLEQWLHRHFVSAMTIYAWLVIRGLSFTRSEMQTDDILAKVKPREPHTISNIWRNVKESPALKDLWIWKYMTEHGTWPTPIIILENPGTVSWPDGSELQKPLHLLEGHRRLGVLYAKVREGEKVGDTHKIWLATAK